MLDFMAAKRGWTDKSSIGLTQNVFSQCRGKHKSADGRDAIGLKRKAQTADSYPWSMSKVCNAAIRSEGKCQPWI
jgi:hypothetical protein